MDRTDQSPLSKTEETLFQSGFVLATTCVTNETRLIQAIIEHLSKQADATPGMQVVVWTDGKITRFWKIDPRHTLRPADATLRPCASDTNLPPVADSAITGGAGPTIRSAPPTDTQDSLPPETVQTTDATLRPPDVPSNLD